MKPSTSIFFLFWLDGKFGVGWGRGFLCQIIVSHFGRWSFFFFLLLFPCFWKGRSCETTIASMVSKIEVIRRKISNIMRLDVIWRILHDGFLRSEIYLHAFIYQQF